MNTKDFDKEFIPAHEYGNIIEKLGCREDMATEDTQAQLWYAVCSLVVDQGPRRPDKGSSTFLFDPSRMTRLSKDFFCLMTLTDLTRSVCDTNENIFR